MQRKFEESHNQEAGMKIRTFLPYLFLTFSFLLFTCFLYAQEEVLPDTVDVEEEFLIDNEDSLNYFEEGTWQYSNAQAYGPTSRYAYVNQHPKACAHFFTTLPKSGFYELFEIVPATANASDHGVYVLSVSNVVVDSLVLNQNVGSGNWVSLGRHYLPDGQKIEIKVVDTGEGTQGLVLRADAIKISLEEELIEEVIEDEVIEEELLEEEVIEEEVIEEKLPEEEAIEEELPEEEIFEEEVEEVVEEEPVEEVTEEVSFFAPGWGFKAYVNLGLVEPWGDPGTGAAFDMGFKGQLGAQINPAKFISLPAILSPLSAEVLTGYTMFNHKSLDDVSTSIVSFYLGGRYDISDLVLKYIGFEYPALGIFGFIGFQVNSQSWDFPNREFDSVIAFGSNLGLGVKFNLMNMVGQPVEIDLRFTQMNFLMGDVEDKYGVPISSGGEYSHGENGFLLGFAYPF